MGINFGEVTKDQLYPMAKDSGNHNDDLVSLILGIDGGGAFEIFFESSHIENGKEKSTFFSVDPNGLPNGGRVYNVLPEPLRPVKERLGVSTELRNQFIFNWLNIPVSIISDLFIGKTVPQEPTDDLISKIIAATFPRYEALVRARKYLITGKNSETLFKVLKTGTKDNPIHLNVRLGVNTSDLFVGKDLFTMILDLKQELKPLNNPSATIMSVESSTRILGGSNNMKLFVQSAVGNQNMKNFNVVYSKDGIEVKVSDPNGSAGDFKGEFNQLIDIGDLSPEFNGLIRATPRFLELQINSSAGSSGSLLRMPLTGVISGAQPDQPPVDHLANKQIDLSPPVTASVEPAFGEPVIIEFVGACPPACPDG